MKLEKSEFLVMGQLKTSRTETVEDYLRPRVKTLAVVGVMSPFANYKESRCTLYESGRQVREFSLPGYNVGRINAWNKPLMFFSFLMYIKALFKAVKQLDKKFDYFIGIATFSAMLGVWLRKRGIVKKVIYYCLDYYPPQKGFGFHKLENLIFRKIDAWLIRNADTIWEISPRIKEGRQKYAGMDKDSYSSVIVPLGYADNIRREVPFFERERWTLGFVGTLSDNQGLQLVIEAMPELKKIFPEIKVRVLGSGPYAGQLKDMVRKYGVEDRFIFHGFVKDDEEVYDILSRCVAGLATWTGEESDNSLYADPGKPKLYALLALPIIITDAPFVAAQISELRAGERIKYLKKDFINAVEKIIKSEENFYNYLQGLEKFREFSLARKIFDNALNDNAMPVHEV